MISSPAASSRRFAATVDAAYASTAALPLVDSPFLASSGTLSPFSTSLAPRASSTSESSSETAPTAGELLTALEMGDCCELRPASFL